MRLAAALALAALQGPGQGPAGHGEAPGPRRAIAGLAGFVAVSRLDYGEQEDRLTAVYLFPDRARWQFESCAVERPGQVQIYRCGTEAHQLQSPRGSEEFAGEERDAVLLQMELRRAAMLWPEGFEWSEEGPGLRRTTVYRDSCCRQQPIGSLSAELDDAGRPARLRAEGSAGTREALEIRSWQELEQRTWPREMLLDQGTPVRETVESVETRVHFVDLYFVPPDRRVVHVAGGPAGSRILSTDLVPITVLRRELPSGISWEEALQQARAWTTVARSELGSGFELDPVPTLELSSAARASACLLRLSRPASAPPPGWQTIPERAGLLLVLEELSEVDPAHLGPLFSSIPPGTSPGTPYLRVHDRREGRIEVVLPLDPAE